VAETARDKLIRRLAEAQREQEEATMGLIQLELDETLTGLAAAEDQAATALRAATGALAAPLARLAEMDAGIAAAEGRCVEWSRQLADADPDKRAQARAHFDEWSAEIDKLRAGRDEAERGYRPLFEEREQARKNLGVMQGGRRVLAAGMLDPFGALGQQTRAYEAFRQLYLNHVLLRNDREDPEWDMALAELRELCMRSGYRTTDLPTDAELAARALEASGMASAAVTPPDPVPSGQEVIALDKAGVLNAALERSPSMIEDYRNTPPVPRNARVAEYRQVPTLRDMGLR
jgi:hypothetical protein